MPSRIQRRRTKGWRKPAGAIDVTRVGRWGNPFAILRDTAGWWTMVYDQHGIPHSNPRAAAVTAVAMFRDGIAHQADIVRKHMRGRDLMCYCTLCPAHADGRPLGTACESCDPCHADVLLEIANA